MKIKCPCGAEYEIAAMPENDSPRTVERLETDNKHLHRSLGKYIELEAANKRTGIDFKWDHSEHGITNTERLHDAVREVLTDKQFADYEIHLHRKCL